jgi:hypothetical protein
MLIVSALFISLLGCSKYKEELAHLDKLQEELEANKQEFNIDIHLFEERVKYMDSVLLIFNNFYSDSVSLELGNDLSRYKGIKKIYKMNIGLFNDNVAEQAELEKQLVNLHTDLEGGKLSDDAFKSYFSNEKLDVLKLTTASKAVKKTLYELESEYTRLNENVMTEIPEATF